MLSKPLDAKQISGRTQSNNLKMSNAMMKSGNKEEFNKKLLLSGFFEDDCIGDVKIECKGIIEKN